MTTTYVEREELRRTVRAFLDERAPEQETRRLMASDEGHDPVLWRQLACDLGVVGITIPTELGGAGMGWPELHPVIEETGRALLCAPLFSTVILAVGAILRCSDEAIQKELLPGIAAGDTVAALAWVEPHGRWLSGDIRMEASRSPAGWQLSGVKSFVLDGCIADVVVLAARTRHGISLFLVDRDAPGLTRVPNENLDQTRKHATLRFDATPARLIGDEGTGGTVLDQVLVEAGIAAAVEAVGGAQRVLQMSVAYAQTRIQFGRPIGSFQAIKHKCADMLADVETARAVAEHASTVASSWDDENPALVASLAKAYCADAYVRVAAENVQVHGGIGFTWEHPAHLYLKRAKWTQTFLGSSRTHRDTIGRLLAW
jgi:alkylation response protein AidB-like acyl-CoA dehydrogenase